MPIHEISDWAALQNQIKAGGQAVSGMTPAEAQAALKTQVITTKGGTTLHVYNPGATPSPQPQLQFPGTEAPIDAYWEYVNQGGTTNVTGAATSGSNVINNSNITVTETAAGATGVAGLLSMNLPTAAAAIAPLAGVALGAGLYTLNPPLWEKISRALLPFCYDDTELLPVVVDENGVTYYPREAIDAVKDALEGEAYTEIGGDIAGYANEFTPYPFKYMTGLTRLDVKYGQEGSVLHPYSGHWTISSPDVRIVPFNNNYGYLFASSSSFGCQFSNSITPDYVNRISRTINGQVYTWYYIYYDWSGGMLSTPTVPSVQEAVKPEGRSWIEDLSFALCYDAISSYPEGTSEWMGPRYPATVTPLNVFTRYNDVGDAMFLPFYPITTPVGDPGVSSKPNEVPNPPTSNPDEAPAIDPWITPDPNKKTYPDGVPQSNPAELPGTDPDYTPKLNPESDPSQEPAEEPIPEQDPSTAENNSGSSPIPIIPEFIAPPSAASSLLHVYNPTQSQIDSFGSWLWTTFSGDLIDTVSKLFNDPMDAVIGLHELYATPATSGSATIRAGFLDSGVSSKLVGSRYTSINCGSVVVPEYYQNYLDYSPYTKCFVYLPFVGIVPVSADDIIGNAVQIKYNVDSYTGCCIAIITVAREGYSSTVYQFEGNCGVEIPITSGYQSTLIGGLLGVAGTAISGSPHVGLAAASLGRANLGKNEVSHSGSFGSSYGAMGAKIPYIIVKRPTQKSVVNYNDEYGFPAHKRVRIGDCSGYLRAREIHVVSPTATDEEKARIEEMLKEGVFVK